MFLTNRILDLVVKTKDDAFAIALSSFDASHALAIAAKENEISYLRERVKSLEEQLRYEKSRADALVDRLLIRDAKVAAVAPAAVEHAKQKDEVAVARLKEVFDQLNDIGAEIPAKEHRAFDFAGGGTGVAAHV